MGACGDAAIESQTPADGTPQVRRDRITFLDIGEENNAEGDGTRANPMPHQGGSGIASNMLGQLIANEVERQLEPCTAALEALQGRVQSLEERVSVHLQDRGSHVRDALQGRVQSLEERVSVHLQDRVSHVELSETMNVQHASLEKLNERMLAQQSRVESLEKAMVAHAKGVVDCVHDAVAGWNESQQAKFKNLQELIANSRSSYDGSDLPRYGTGTHSAFEHGELPGKCAQASPTGEESRGEREPDDLHDELRKTAGMTRSGSSGEREPDDLHDKFRKSAGMTRSGLS